MKNGAFAQSIYKQSVNQMEELDTIRYGEQGRVFAYARAGATALAVAKLTQSAIPVATANRETVAADAAIGATSVSITFGAAVTADYYKDGFIYDCILGALYRVKSHEAGTTAVIVNLKEPLRVAWTAASSKATAIQNRQNLVIVQPFAALTSSIAGIPPIAVDINYYFWNQVKGPALCLVNGTWVVGEELAPSNAVAGSAEPLIHATTWDVTIGTVLSVDADTEYGLINLAIPGY